MSSSVRPSVSTAGDQLPPTRQVLYVGSAEHVKRMAKRLKKFAGVSHGHALQAMARAVGFKHWYECHTVLDDPKFKGRFPPDLPAEIRHAMIGSGAVRLAEYLSQHVQSPVCSEEVAREFLEIAWMSRPSSATEARFDLDSQLAREPRSTGPRRATEPSNGHSGGRRPGDRSDVSPPAVLRTACRRARSHKLSGRVAIAGAISKWAEHLVNEPLGDLCNGQPLHRQKR